MSTYFAKKEEQQRRWYLIDAKGKVLGKVAVAAANILRGKNKPTFTPHVDTGDFVVVVNAAEVVLTGRKETGKKYMRVTGYIGNEKIQTASEIRRGPRPGRLVEQAVRGMVPHNRLGRKILTKLKVYPGPDHPHTAQKPIPVSL
ncbi:MAG: 50S ribosomal protein L13 [Verrucomicrobiae bacterium]|nr:50S ribosomal protein L13 [Verrucomicrobiae bacterium]MDW8343757.1 50S ribosomal protein L13 [Verrucomicrobiae bacterium]